MMTRKQFIKFAKYLFFFIVVFSLGVGMNSLFGSNGSFTPPDLYLDDLPFPASYVVKTDASYFWIVEDNGNILGNSTDDDSIIQGAINNASSDGGGLVFVRAGSYSASVTVKNDTTLMMEIGVSGITYTRETTGLIFRYADGYAFIDGNLNMTGNQIVSGLFHSGSTRPTSPSEAQWFYDTDDHALFVYNGTAWEDYTGAGAQGAQGEQGEQGLGGLGDYSYFVYQNGSNTESRDFEGTLLASSTDDNDVLVWSLGNATTGLVQLGEGTFTIDATTLPLGKQGRLRGMGTLSTLLDVTANINCVTVDPSATDSTWGISDLGIDMNQQSGHGIYCTHSASVSPWDVNNAYIRNVWIGYVKTGYSGIYLKDVYQFEISYPQIVTYGTGIYIAHSNGDSMNWGNSLFEHLQIDLKGNSCIGLDVVQGSGQRSLTLTSFDWIQVFQSNWEVNSGSIGIRMSGGVEQRYTTFTQIVIENVDIGMYLEDCRDVVVVNPTILSCNNYTVQIEGTTHGTHFIGGRFTGAPYWDNSDATANTYKRNLIDGTFLENGIQNGQWTCTQWVFGTVTYNEGGTYFQDHYEVDASGWSNPHGITFEGRVVSMYNGDQSPAYRTWTYLNGGWRYEELV